MKKQLIYNHIKQDHIHGTGTCSSQMKSYETIGVWNIKTFMFFFVNAMITFLNMFTRANLIHNWENVCFSLLSPFWWCTLVDVERSYYLRNIWKVTNGNNQQSFSSLRNSVGLRAYIIACKTNRHIAARVVFTCIAEIKRQWHSIKVHGHQKYDSDNEAKDKLQILIHYRYHYPIQ